MNTIATSIPCSLESEQLAEPLHGTAPKAQVWFALEYTPRWGHKAWEESEVDPATRQAVDTQLANIPGARWLLIRQKDRRAGVRFFAAVLGDAPALYRFELSSYADLLGLDLAAIAAQAPAYAAQCSQEPLLLVCTNGQRDACCVLHGIAVYNALQREFGAAVWESSHHGGHRFAANLLALPTGRSYGRLRPDNAVQIAQAVQAGQVPLEFCRGYTAWPEPAQAAELLLRQQLGYRASQGVRLLASQPQGEGRWLCHFALPQGERQVLVARSEGAPVHASCGDEKTVPMINFALLGNI